MEILDKSLRSVGYVPDGKWAWENFKHFVKELIQQGQFKSVMEIGGGRYPIFTKDELEALGIRYTSNDISAYELSLAPDWIGKAHFDIQTDDPAILGPHKGAYDFIFSRNVMEHLPDYRRAYANIHELLAPGGVGVALHPTLYSFPFVINKLIPETVSGKLLRTLLPHRTQSERPKFPAYYSGCYNSGKVRAAIRNLGFSEVTQVPFYSHDYYRNVPVLRDLHLLGARVVEAMKLSALTAYCFTVVRK